MKRENKEKKTEKNEVEGKARRERKQQRCLRQRRYCIIGMTCKLKGSTVLPSRTIKCRDRLGSGGQSQTGLAAEPRELPVTGDVKINLP